MNNKLTIHKVKFSNFQTFLDETEISFLLERKDVDACGGFASRAENNIYLSPAITVAGGEQSRFNSIKPLACLANFISSISGISADSAISLSTHPLSREPHGSIVLDFELNKKLYRYVLEFGNNRVFFESLHVKSSKFFSYVFVRDAKTSLVDNTIKVAKFGVTEKTLRYTSPNVSVIATAAERGSPLAQKLVAEFSALAASNNVVRPSDILPADILAAANMFAWNDVLRRQMSDFLVSLDSELLDVSIEKHQYNLSDGQTSELYIPYAVRCSAVAGKEHKVQPLWGESRDTLAVFVLLSRLLPVLHDGGVVMVDCLDDGVPDEILPSLLDLFLNQDTNPHGAQLLFTANSMELLKSLQAKQIYLMRRLPIFEPKMALGLA